MIDGFVLAMQFLTRINLRKKVDFTDENVRKAIVFYPVVGIAIGIITAIPTFLIPFSEYRVSGLLSLLLYLFITGGLHIDGVADVADAFLSNRSYEKVMAILKDSSIGTFGSLSIAILLMSKYVMYSSLNTLPTAILLSIINARFASVHAINHKKTIGNGGIADLFHQNRPGKGEYFLLSVYLLVVSFFNPLFIIPTVISLLTEEYICHISYKKMGGINGDVLGTIVEYSELTSLLMFWGIKVWILS